MAGEEECMKKHRDMEGEWEKAMDTNITLYIVS